ncbi:MAG: DNA-deoxyinosine glycosylase [Gammaproteobacteria bacterium]|jgi:double-stranded uracil-DNA glycosylase
MSRPVSDPNLLTSFPPVVGDRPHTLILGSMPGERSLREQRYYAFPQNSFWPIMAQICGFAPESGYAGRLNALKAAGFALWDVLQHCERHGSLDSAITADTEIPNKIIELLDKHKTIDRICFNGARAETSFRRHLLRDLPGRRAFTLIRLPSTSPAYASMRFEEKLEVWRESLLR